MSCVVRRAGCARRLCSVQPRRLQGAAACRHLGLRRSTTWIGVWVHRMCAECSYTPLPASCPLRDAVRCNQMQSVAHLAVTRCSQMQSDAISRAPGRYEMQSDAIRCNQSRTCPLRWWSGWKPCFRQRCSSRRPGGSGCESRKTPCRGVREGERTMATASSSMLW